MLRATRSPACDIVTPAAIAGAALTAWVVLVVVLAASLEAPSHF